MKQRYLTGRLPEKNKGFTLIEFIVASSLAIIVIMAAGGTYFMTRKLNASAQQRLDIQQNLRNTALQITRDARLAGHFGCYSTGNTAEIVSDITPPNFKAATGTAFEIDTSKNTGFGIYKGNYTEGTASLPALFFIYGQGEAGVTEITGLTPAATNTISKIKLASGIDSNKESKNLDALQQTLANGGYAVLSSCRSAVAFRAPKIQNHTLNLPTPLTDVSFSTHDTGTAALSKLYASAYVFNETTKQLFRTDLGHDGTWQSPQLIANGINSMDIGFGYTKDCPASFSASAANETFTFSNTNSEAQLPSVVQIRLNYDLDIRQPNRTGTTPATITTADYLISATVRGGNICGNRMPK